MVLCSQVFIQVFPSHSWDAFRALSLQFLCVHMGGCVRHSACSLSTMCTDLYFVLLSNGVLCRSDRNVS